MILCGGYGTRMGTAGGRVPKPMLSVGDQPLLWHVMRCYADQGHRRFVLCTGYLGGVIDNWFAAHRPLDWEVRILDTGLDTSTGGRLLLARPALDEDRSFFFTYGDGVADVDLAALYAHHRSESRLATVTALRPTSRFGILDLSGGRVTRFREKPQLDDYVSGGFFVFEPGAFDYMNASEPLENGALGRLAEAGQLSAYRHEGFWLSVDTPRDLTEINRIHDHGGAPWLVASS